MRRTIALMVGALLGLSAASSSSNAGAQEAPRWQGILPAPSNAFELRLGSGYTQGIGNISPGNRILNVAGAGIGFNLDLDYRITPLVSLGLETQYQEFATENNIGSRGLAMNLGITGHAAPLHRVDPFLRLGTGYRLLWDVGPTNAPTTNNMFHGFDALTAKLGIDFRVTKDAAFAPVIGADLQTFSWVNGTSLGTTQLATFVYGGLQGRFDWGANTPQTPVASNVRGPE
jgi:opacity protein-like surface antigen